MTDRISEAEHAIEALLATPIDGPDDLGRVDYLARKLYAFRSRLIAEAEPARGTIYRIVEGGSWERSYNGARIIRDFGREGSDLYDLHHADVARIGWQWTNLRKHANELNVELLIGTREVRDDGDLETPHVGEVWRPRTSVEAIKP